VILVGEMRDREAVEIGLSASETGHLVLTPCYHGCGLPSASAGMFPSETSSKSASASRIPAVDHPPAAAAPGRRAGRHLRDPEPTCGSRTPSSTANPRAVVYDIMEAGNAFGMITFDQHLVSLYEQGLITQETALAYASHRGSVGRGVDMIKSSRGEATTDIGKLEIDKAYNKMI
jgi:twitching motility protein PilT